MNVSDANPAQNPYLYLVQQHIEINKMFALAWMDVATAISGTVLARNRQADSGIAERPAAPPARPSPAVRLAPVENMATRVNPTRRATPSAGGRFGSVHRRRHDHLLPDGVFDELLELLVAEDITAAAR